MGEYVWVCRLLCYIKTHPKRFGSFYPHPQPYLLPPLCLTTISFWVGLCPLSLALKTPTRWLRIQQNHTKNVENICASYGSGSTWVLPVLNDRNDPIIRVNQCLTTHCRTEANCVSWVQTVLDWELGCSYQLSGSLLTILSAVQLLIASPACPRLCHL